MAHRRMLSRRISQSKKVNSLSWKSQIIWTWTIPFLDDYGRFTADEEDIKTEVFPKNKLISEEDILQSLGEIAAIGLIIIYEVDNRFYQQYNEFDSFQTFRNDRTKHSICPPVSNVIPKTPNDTHKLSEVKLSKVKLNNTPSLALQAAFKEIPLNLYALIGKLKKQVGWPKDFQIPEEVLLKVCATYNKDKVKQPWAWFTTSIKRACEDYSAKKNIEEGEKFKKMPIAKAIEGLVRGIG